MLISVVVPAYNEERYIGACLSALCAQEHPGFDYEVIVVDDGSSDRTGAIAAGFGVRIVTQPNGGVAKARQAGFLAARGEYVASTDADTVCPPDWLRRIVAHLSRGLDTVGVYGPAHLLDVASRQDGLIFALSLVNCGVHAALGRPMCPGFNFAVKRDAWAAAGGFDTDWASSEDVGLSLRMRNVGKLVFDRRLVVHTSGRRLRSGFRAVARLYGVNYLRVFWLNKPGLPFSNIR